MPYVWISSTSGVRRFVDDRYLNPCHLCGKSISVCQASDCAEVNADKAIKYCDMCQQMTQACICDKGETK